jgi:diguanylate cyclase (GGDEF)-like protein
LARLREDPRTRLMPVVLLTGDGAPACRVRGLDSGADDYVAKPFHPGELAARVAALLRRRRRDLGANPLTRLPGSPDIREEVERRIAAREAFGLLHVDIDRFKSFNDAYGYARGDALLLETAGLLAEAVQAECAGRGFLGHVGGDDFVIVAPEARAEPAARAAAGLFDAASPSFYREEDRLNGFVETVDRRGVRRRSGLVTLSIGGATTARRRLDSYAKAVAIAGEMKSYLKARPSEGASRFALDRRSDP